MYLVICNNKVIHQLHNESDAMDFIAEAVRDDGYGAEEFVLAKIIELEIEKSVTVRAAPEPTGEA